MATNKRMFSNDIVGSDAFLEMPTSTQALYFHLGMRADDDGFVNPKVVMRTIGVNDDELKLLAVKKFVIPFNNGVLVIKHWKINNNKIQGDRYKTTLYQEEFKTLFIKENGAYTLDKNKGIPVCLQSVNNSLPQNRIEENRREENRRDISPIKKFIPPTLKEVEAYCLERKNKVNPNKFIDFYSSKGWMVGKNKMKDWKASVRTWENSDNKVEVYQNNETQTQRDDKMNKILSKVIQG